MGQQPNIEIHLEDLPRPTSDTAPPQRWKPDRPGDMAGPTDVPWGGMYGRPGPDTGYALKLLKGRDLGIQDPAMKADASAAVAAVAAARASHFGRAPTAEDIDVALLIFGFSPEGLPEALVAGILKDRVGWFSGLAHSPARAGELVSVIAIESLALSPSDLRARMSAGERITELG